MGSYTGYVRRARVAGLICPCRRALDDESLELLLFQAPTAASQSRRPTPVGLMSRRSCAAVA